MQTVGLYTNGAFVDLCRGPHAPTTSRSRRVKLQSVAGAYWRGDANRQMLTRVYGTAFLSKEELEAHLQRLEEARARDHRKLGRELELFQFSETSPGSAFWLPQGHAPVNELIGVSREMAGRAGYTEVKTPQIYDSQLWKTSGHWDKYRENMFVTEAEGRQMALKPMNCPGHCQLFKRRRCSYRDLPVRYSEPGLLHRNEPSRHAARPAARAPLHAGRRPHLLHRGAGPRRDRRLPGPRVRHLRAVRLRGRARAVDAA